MSSENTLTVRVAEAEAKARIAEIRRNSKADAQDDKIRRAQERKDAKQAARSAKKQQSRADFKAVAEQWKPTITGLGLMSVSVAVAWPAQYHYFAEVTGSQFSGAAMAALVEGGTWFGAVCETAAAAKGRPTWPYRTWTWTMASVAAAINWLHGIIVGGEQVGMVFAIASLLGPAAWAVLARLRSDQRHDRTTAQIRLDLARAFWYPITSLRATKLAVGHGTDRLDVWDQVWSDRTQRAQNKIRPTRPDSTADPTRDDKSKLVGLFKKTRKANLVESAPQAINLTTYGHSTLQAPADGPAIPHQTALAVPGADAAGSATGVESDGPVRSASAATRHDLAPYLEKVRTAANAGELPHPPTIVRVREYLGVGQKTATAVAQAIRQETANA